MTNLAVGTFKTPRPKYASSSASTRYAILGIMLSLLLSFLGPSNEGCLSLDISRQLVKDSLCCQVSSCTFFLALSTTWRPGRKQHTEACGQL